MSNERVLREIARLEGELLRIQRELDTLRKSVGAPSTRRTQAFSQVDKDAVTREMPASQPPPQPSVPVKSDVVPTSKSDRRMETGPRTGLSDYPSANAPVPSRPRSNPAPDAGRYEFVGEGKTRRR